MLRDKILHKVKPDNHEGVEFSVCGIFNTQKVEWEYYVISTYISTLKKLVLSSDILPHDMVYHIDNVRKYGKKFSTKEEGIKFIEDYKIKWETGSNNTIQEQRDEKINTILDNKDK